MTRIKLLLFVAMIFASGVAGAVGCRMQLKPETSGFLLNPTLDKVTVVGLTPVRPGQVCGLMPNDELLQINDLPIPGEKARKVMSYWKALPKGVPQTLQVRRSGKVVSVVVH